MDNIEIIFIETENDEYCTGWLVKQGEKFADGLVYEEMLGLVAALTMPHNRPCLQWMKTKEQHEMARTLQQVNDNQQDFFDNEQEFIF